MLLIDNLNIFGYSGSMTSGLAAVVFNILAIISMIRFRKAFPKLIIYWFLIAINTMGTYNGVESITQTAWADYQNSGKVCTTIDWFYIGNIIFSVMFATGMAVFSYCVSANSKLTRTKVARRSFLITMGVVVTILGYTAPTVSYFMGHIKPTKRICYISRALPDKEDNLIYNIMMFSIYKIIALILNLVLFPITFHNIKRTLVVSRSLDVNQDCEDKDSCYIKDTQHQQNSHNRMNLCRCRCKHKHRSKQEHREQDKDLPSMLLTYSAVLANERPGSVLLNGSAGLYVTAESHGTSRQSPSTLPSTSDKQIAVLSPGLRQVLMKSIFSSIILLCFCLFDIVDVFTSVVFQVTNNGLYGFQGFTEFIWPLQQLLIALSYNMCYIQAWFGEGIGKKETGGQVDGTS